MHDGPFGLGNGPGRSLNCCPLHLLYRLQRRQWSLVSEPTVAPYLKQRVAGAIAATSSDASRAEGHSMPPSLKRTDPSKGTPTFPAAFPAPSVSIATGQKHAGSEELVATA